jgi:hypothetical protein
MAAKKITIDLIVLCTSKVAASYIEVHKDLIALAVEQANQSFANCGLRNIKLRTSRSIATNRTASTSITCIGWSTARARSRMCGLCAIKARIHCCPDR